MKSRLSSKSTQLWLLKNLSTKFNFRMKRNRISLKTTRSKSSKNRTAMRKKNGILMMILKWQLRGSMKESYQKSKVEVTRLEKILRLKKKRNSLRLKVRSTRLWTRTQSKKKLKRQSQT